MAKRSGKKRARRRKPRRRYTLYYLFALVLVLSVGTLMSLTVFFKINSVSVTGNTLYADEEIKATSGIKLGDNLIRLPTKKIGERIVESYPYAEKVRVRRTLPDAVTIEVTMAEETAALRKSDGRFMIVSEEGRVLKSDAPVCPDGMIPVDGFRLERKSDGDFLYNRTVTENGKTVVEENSEEKSRFETLLLILSAIEENNLTQSIKALDLSDVFDIKMLYEGRLAVCIGSVLDIDYKMRFASLAIDSEVTEATVGLLDVSDRPTAHLREYDIYTEEEWPFSDDLRAEYERKIVKYPERYENAEAETAAKPESGDTWESTSQQ